MMKYVIQFAGLKEGRHEFKFDVDDSFFEQFESSEIKKGKLAVRVILDKNRQVLEMGFFIQGTVQSICDRCLDELDLPLQYQGKLFFKFGEESYELTDEIIILSSSEYRLQTSFLSSPPDPTQAFWSNLRLSSIPPKIKGPRVRHGPCKLKGHGSVCTHGLSAPLKHRGSWVHGKKVVVIEECAFHG